MCLKLEFFDRPPYEDLRALLSGCKLSRCGDVVLHFACWALLFNQLCVSQELTDLHIRKRKRMPDDSAFAETSDSKQPSLTSATRTNVSASQLSGCNADSSEHLNIN